MSNDFKIEKDIPLPNLGRSRSHFPLMDMGVGDSFTFPLIIRQQVSGAAKHLKERRGMYFTTRKIDETTGRVWRIEKPEEESDPNIKDIPRGGE